MRSLLGLVSPYVRHLEEQNEKLLDRLLEISGVRPLTDSQPQKTAQPNGDEPIQAHPKSVAQMLAVLEDETWELREKRLKEKSNA